MRSLGYLLEHQMLGQTARFERYMANMMHVVASGKHIDDKRTESFGKQVEQITKNPFHTHKKAPELNTAADVYGYIYKRLTE